MEQSQDWTWLVHLDLTTDKTSFKALIYSTPTVADLDGDGRSEIVLGTSMGLLYLLDGDNGFVKRFFPLQFHEIQVRHSVFDAVSHHYEAKYVHEANHLCNLQLLEHSLQYYLILCNVVCRIRPK